MKRLIGITSLIGLLFFGTSNLSSAQRTAVNRFFVGIEQQGTFHGLHNGLPSGGLMLECGQYLLNSFWYCGVSASNMNQETDTSPSYFYDNVIYAVHSGWKYRLVGTYSRGFNLYLGGSAFVGINSHEVFRPLREEHSGSFAQNEFIYGVQPSLEFEIYTGSKVAILAAAELQTAFSNSFGSGLFLPVASIGARINL